MVSECVRDCYIPSVLDMINWTNWTATNPLSDRVENSEKNKMHVLQTKSLEI